MPEVLTVAVIFEDSPTFIFNDVGESVIVVATVVELSFTVCEFNSFEAAGAGSLMSVVSTFPPSPDFVESTYSTVSLSVLSTAGFSSFVSPATLSETTFSLISLIGL